jgi:hypothetical protein
MGLNGDDDGERLWEKGDPVVILIRREERTCAGCVSLVTTRLFGENAAACRRRRRKAQMSVKKTRRCDSYIEEKR